MKSSIALIALLICGCATQDAHKVYFRAQEKMREANEVANPKSENLSKAFDALTAGRAQMLDARYDHALRNFNQSIKLSEAAIAESIKNLPSPVPPDVKAETKEVVEEAVVTENTEAVVGNVVEPLVIAELGAEASAAVADNSVVATNAIDAPEESPTPIPAVKAKPKAKVQKPKPKKEVAPLRPGAIVAPAAPSLKKSPTKDLQTTEKVEPTADGETAVITKQSSGEEKRRRVPGVLSFIVNDSSLLQESMTSLNQTGKFLLENPSTTLVLQGTHSGDENRSLIDARFESIKAYLVGKGVPEDQIRLDDEKRRGSSEFKLFVSEH